MDKHPPKPDSQDSGPVSLARVIDEVLQSIDRVDREMEKFYEIHGKDLKIHGDGRARDPKAGLTGSS